MECTKCGKTLELGQWPFCPHPTGYAVAIHDDQLEGGPRWFETMGPEPVYIESKSQWRREVAQRNLENPVRHDSAYYARQRKQHDEKLRDTGSPY